MNPVWKHSREAELYGLAIKKLGYKPPKAGGGVNRSLPSGAWELRRAGCPIELAPQALNHACADCGRDLRKEELVRAVRLAYGLARRAAQREPYQEPIQRSKAALRAACALPRVSVEDIEARSPVPLETIATLAPEDFIAPLYGEDAWIHAVPDPASSLAQDLGIGLGGDTHRLREWRESPLRLKDCAWWVPYPLTQRCKCRGEKISFRCAEIAGDPLMTVVEFDRFKPDNQAHLAWHLQRPDCPLVLLVNSRGKSFHAHFWTPTPKIREDLRRRALPLGADGALWSLSQICRLPHGIRQRPHPKNPSWRVPRKQFVHFFNPEQKSLI